MEKIKLIMSEEQFILIMKGIHDLYSFLVGTPAKNELSQVMWNYQIKSIEKTFEVIKEYKTLNNKYFRELGFKDTKVICESVYFLKNNLGEYDEEVDCIIEFIKENNGYDFFKMNEKCTKGKVGKADVGEDAFSIIAERHDYEIKNKVI